MNDNVDHPISFMQLQKDQVTLAHSYSHLFQLPSTGLRFFCIWSMETRYGANDFTIYS